MPVEARINNLRAWNSQSHDRVMRGSVALILKNRCDVLVISKTNGTINRYIFTDNSSENFFFLVSFDCLLSFQETLFSFFFLLRFRIL